MAATMTSFASWNLTSLRTSPSSPPTTSRFFKPVHCTPIIQQQQEAGVAILCEDCNGRGWLLCDFCKGQKTNVKSETNRIYRRCPSCRAIGQVLCSSARFSNVSHSQITTMVRRCLFKPPISCIKNVAHDVSSSILFSANI